MRGSRSALVVLWVTLALVVVASGWIGVRMVGQALVPAAAPVLSDAEMDALLATAKAQPGLAPTDGQNGGQNGNGRPSPGPTSSDQSPGTGDGSGGGAGGGGQQGGAAGGDGGGGETASPKPSAKTEVRTFRSRGGSAVVACTGNRIALRAWSPAVGYSLEEREVGYDELEVKFEGSSGESKIHATCEAGVPVAEVDSGDDSGDDSDDD